MGASQWKRYLPKSPSDWFAVTFTVGAVHLVGLYELFVILPYIDADRSKTFWMHVTLGIFLYINVMSSFVLLIITDPSTNRKGLVLPSVLRQGWKYCSGCESNTPPRAYHCWNCDICVLRRDHHCVFTGNCVGFGNHRYFITMVLHLTIGAIYCNYLNMDYTWEILGGLTLKSAFTMIMPLFSWVLGFAEAFTFIVAFVSALCVLGFFLLGALIGYHVINLFHGQTTYERGQGIHDYDLGWVENLRNIMGNYWYISWISPWISSPPIGDGTEFSKTRRGFENIKDM